MADNMILQVVELELDRMMKIDVAGVETRLTHLGWRSALNHDTGGTFGKRWHLDSDEHVRVQTGQQGGEFYLGLIADFATDADADACATRILERLRPHLAAAGFGSDRGDDAAHLWTNETHAVSLYRSHQRQQSTHVLPPVIQLAIEPVSNLVASV